MWLLKLEDADRDLMLLFAGFAAIGETKYTSDVNWGCMLRSSQMLVAQVLSCVTWFVSSLC